VLLSVICFSPEPWRQFFASAIPGHSATMLGTHSRLGMPTVYMFVLMLADTCTAILAQAMVALFVAVLAWRVFRHSQDFVQNLAVFALGGFLMTPYGFIYDLPLVGVAAKAAALATAGAGMAAALPACGGRPGGGGDFIGAIRLFCWLFKGF
jgi:hypothetical protein